MRPITVTVGPLTTSVADAVALSQTPTTAFTINGSLASGGVATLDKPRRVLLTTSADESAKTVTIIGTDVNGQVQTEVLTGAVSSTATTALDFKTITSARVSSAFAGAATLGTATIASSMWIRMDEWAPAQSTLQVTVSGTVNYTVEQTMQDPNSPTDPVLPYLVTWLPNPDPNVVGSTDSWNSYFAYTPLWARLTLNSGTGSATMTISQNSAVPR